MVTRHRYAHDGTEAVQSPGSRLLAGLLVAVTLALAAPAVAEARDHAREDGATVVIGGLVGRTTTPQAGAIGIGDLCWDSNGDGICE